MRINKRKSMRAAARRSLARGIDKELGRIHRVKAVLHAAKFASDF
jgi:hypothetical protein